MYAAVKTGHKLFLSSLGFESVEIDLKLLKDLQCDVMLLTAESKPPIVEEVLSKRAMRTMMVPTLEDMLMTGEGPVYPYNKTYSQAKHEPFVVLHTSGSTGFPKPVLLNHVVKEYYSAFHNSTVQQYAFWPFQCIQTPYRSYRLRQYQLSWSTKRIYTLESMQAFLGPALSLTLFTIRNTSENLKRLRYVTFGGSPLPQEVGNKVKDLAHLFLCFGTTESGYYALEETDPEDWQYASFSPIMGCELRPFSEGLYECFFVRSDSLPNSQGIFSTVPSLEEYSAKDLYSKHPTKEGLWLYEGRGDDVLIFFDTHRHYPQETERILNAHPAVNSAIVGGHGRLKTALLIQAKTPPGTQEERSARLAEIWPSIELANKKIASSQGQITEDMVVFTSTTRPMVRAGKGSVLRHKTAELYSSDLDQLFIKHAKESQP